MTVIQHRPTRSPAEQAHALVERIDPSPTFARALIAALTSRVDTEVTDNEVWIGCKEFARAVGIHHNTVTNWCKRGRLKHITLPSGIRRIAYSEITRIKGQREVHEPTTFPRRSDYGRTS